MKNIFSIFLLCLVAIPNFCNAQTWTQKGASLDGEAEWTYFTRSVDISADGNVVATASISDQGIEIFTWYVKVYEWQSGTWTQRGSDINTGSLSSLSAVSISSDGNTVAVSGNTDVEGHNYSVFSWDGISWSQKGLSIGMYGSMYNQEEPAWAGGPVSLSSDGNILAIGAPIIVTDIIVDGEIYLTIGLAKVFLWNNGAWEQMGSDIIHIPTSVEDYQSNFGHAISLSTDGHTIAIGSPATLTTLNGAIQYFGSCRMYEWSGTDWLQKGSTITGLNEDDRFGWSVSLSSDGNTVAVGAPLNIGSGQFEGSVRVFSWSGSSWINMGSSISGEIGFDQSGWSVSLSSDGNTVAIGAPANDGNGNSSGHVRIYQWDDQSWLQSGNDIDGQGIINLEGHAVSISSDGHTVAMGARENPVVNGENVRHVRVFSDISVGVNEINSDNELNVYPNPTNRFFTITLGAMYSNITCEIFSVDGQLIYGQEFVFTNRMHLEIDGAPGLYYVRISAENGNISAFKMMRD